MGPETTDALSCFGRGPARLVVHARGGGVRSVSGAAHDRSDGPTALRWAAMSIPPVAAVAPEPSAPEGDTWLGLADVALPTEAATAVGRASGLRRRRGVRRHGARPRRGPHRGHPLEYEAYEEQVVPVLERGRRRRCAAPTPAWVAWRACTASDRSRSPTPPSSWRSSAPHRDEAFAAARLAIDEVKATAPIWKREHWDGGVDWGRCDHDAPHDAAARGAPAEVAT